MPVSSAISEVSANRLALGTVQFGVPYGISNANGQVGRAEAGEILAIARGAGIDTLDTAVGYGTSEALLGHIGVGGWRVVTKAPALPESCGDVSAWLATCLMGSLERLRVARVDALLLHRPGDLLGPQGQTLFAALRSERRKGRAGKIGYSVYAPAELDALVERFPPDIVQAPLNVFDRRLVTSGWLARLRSAGIEVHVRSAFLQGLLLMAPADVPAEFGRWNAHFARWQDWLRQSSVGALQAALSFAVQSDVDRFVVGVTTARELREILASIAAAPITVPEDLAIADEDLINPSRWGQL